MVLLGLLAFALVLSFGASAPSSAQAAPTATPTDPIWRAFSAARAAIQKERKVDLTIVRKYDWEQSQWTGSIDTCNKDIVITDMRSVYFGWTFTITSMKGDVYQARVSFDLKAVTVCSEVVTAPAPAANNAANGNLPAPVAGSAAVGGFELGGQVIGLGQPTITQMQSAGMKWVKWQIDYHLGDDPSKAAGVIGDTHGKGFKVLLSVKGYQNEMGDFDNFVNSFAQFLGGVAKQGADAIEVWNEPNIDREWPSGSINGTNYVKMLAPAFNAIKSNNPNTLVISAAPAPTGFFGTAGCGSGGCNDDVFMQQMAAASAAQYMDCIGLHYNEGIIGPDQNSGDPRGDNYPTRYFNSMLQRGYGPFGGKPVCWTELGYLSPEGYGALPPAFGWAGNVTVAQQASWLASAATISAQSGKVRLMIVFNINFSGFSGNDPQGGYAIVRPDGNCPACSTLGAVAK
jgi:hypothetical protein